jgi:hypothetical protein
MKVYALRQMITSYGYMPALGYHSSLEAAKKQAKKEVKRTDEWDIAEYYFPKLDKKAIIDLLNGDSLTCNVDGLVPRDYLEFIDVVYESAALKRYRKKIREE